MSYYDACMVEPMTWRGKSDGSVTDRAVWMMNLLGFEKLKSYCVYRGRVGTLVEMLRADGWVAPAHPNPFLLEHPESVMTFNYAEDAEHPSKRHVAFFRGCV